MRKILRSFNGIIQFCNVLRPAMVTCLFANVIFLFTSNLKAQVTPPTGVSCTTGNPAFIFTEEFDVQGAWTGDIGSGDGFWNFGETGGTTSSNTGPDGAFSGSTYAYYESSGGVTNTAEMVSPPISVGIEDAELSFAMHAFGDGIGTLHVGVSTSSTGPWDTLFTQVAQLQTSSTEAWALVGADLSGYLGSTVYILFSHTGTGDFNGDMSIDLMRVENCVNCLAPAFDTAFLTEICANSEFTVTVNVTELGDGTPTFFDGTNTTPAVLGTNVLGPYPAGTAVNLVLQHGSDPICDIPVGTFVDTCPPPNDDCINATLLTVDSDLDCDSPVFGTVKNATASQDPEGCSGTFDDDVWYSFTATDTIHQVIVSNITGSTQDLVFQLSSGSCGALTELQCHDTPNTGFTATGLTPGSTYYLRVATWISTTGQTTSFDICIGTPPPPPANNICANASSINVGGFGTCPGNIVTGTTNLTTNTEPVSCDGIGTDFDIWYTFTVPENGDYQFNSIQGAPGIVLYSGSCGALVEVACINNTNGILNGLSTGVTYIAQIWTDSQQDTVRFCIQQIAPPPANDECTGAIALTVNPDLNCGSFSSGTILSATPSPEPVSCAGSFDDDVWYSFVAVDTTHAIQVNNISGGLTDLVYQLSTGSCGAINELICHDTPNSGFTATGLTIGTTYFVRVATFTITPGQTTNFEICIGTPPPPPANDLCENATTLNCADSLTNQTTISATGSSGTSCASTIGNNVWYSFAGNDQTITVTVTPEPGDFDVQLDVYASSDGTCNTITCLDDDSDFSNGPASVTFAAISGTTYYFNVGNVTSSGVDGNFSIDVFCDPCTPPSFSTQFANVDCGTSSELTAEVIISSTGSASTVDIFVDGSQVFSGVPAGSYNAGTFPLGASVGIKVADSASPACSDSVSVTLPTVCPPQNDNCTSATPITCGQTLANQTTIGASGAEQNSCVFTQGDPVWYVFTGNDQVVNLTVTPEPGDFDPQVDVLLSLDGTCNPDSLVCVEDGQNISNGVAVVPPWIAASGNIYYIRVGHYLSSGPQGNFTIEAQCSSCQAPEFDLSNDPSNCPTSAFIAVDVTSLGLAASVNITNDGGAPPITGVGIDTHIVGPFTVYPDTITIIVADAADPTCADTAEIFIGCPPDNDECANAEPLDVETGITCTNPTSGTTAFATASNEATGCTGTEDDDVWYSFKADGTSHIISVTNIQGTTTDMAYGVYSGDCGSLVEIACTDNDAGLTVTGLTPGETYYVQVYTWSSLTQSVTFDICLLTTPPPPPNDSCESATTLACGDSLTMEYTIGATGSSTTSCLGSIGDNVWYVLTGNGEEVTVTVIPDGWDPQVDVYLSTDGTCNNITCLDAVDSGLFDEAETIAIQAFAGNTYYINVGPWISSDDGGTFSIDAKCTGCIVTTTQDNVSGSLRNVLANCTSNMVVISDSLANDTLQLDAPLSLTTDVGIKADANNDIHVQANSAQAFIISGSANVQIEGLNILAGSASSGSAIENSATLTINDVNVFANGSTTPVVNTGTLNVQGDSNVNN